MDKLNVYNVPPAVRSQEVLALQAETEKKHESGRPQVRISFQPVPGYPHKLRVNQADSGDALAEELSHFGVPLSSIPFSTLFKIGCKLIWESLLLGSSVVSSTVLNNAASILLNRTGTAGQQAAMGTALAFNRWLFYGIFQAIHEKFGIDWSRSYGAKQYHLTKAYFYQAFIVLFTTFALITLPGYFLSEHMLLAVGTPAALAADVGKTLRSLAIADAVEMIDELIQCFAVAQGHESLFGKMAIVSLAPSLFAAYYFVEVLHLGAVGWVYSKIVFDSISFVTACTITICVSHPETWGRISLSSITNGLGDCFVDSFKYALGSYTEFLGYIIGDYFVILTHDENQIAAFTIAMNLATLMYCLGEAFATIMRTRMNILIGKKANQKAKNFSMFFFLLVGSFAITLIMIIWFLREKIAAIYTDNTPELYRLFLTMMVVLIIFVPTDLAICSVGIVMKTLGLIERFIGWTFGCFVVANGVFCTIMHLLGLMNSAVAYSTMGGCTYLIICMSAYKAFSLDWTEIQLQDDDDEEEELPEEECLLDARSF